MFYCGLATESRSVQDTGLLSTRPVAGELLVVAAVDATAVPFCAAGANLALLVIRFISIIISGTLALLLSYTFMGKIGIQQTERHHQMQSSIAKILAFLCYLSNHSCSTYRAVDNVTPLYLQGEGGCDESMYQTRLRKYLSSG